MTELLTAEQMRAIEKAAIDSGAVTGLELMERAGQGVVAAIFEEWPELGDAGGAAPGPPEYLGQDEGGGPRRAVVLCGPGNNGGDGFVVARLLKERGWEVEVFLYGDPGKLPPDARVNYERWGEMGDVLFPTKETAFQTFSRLNDAEQPDIWVDAIFGTGLSRPVGGTPALAIAGVRMSMAELVHSPAGKVVAIDLPSGIDSDSGKRLIDVTLEPFFAQSIPLFADITVTFSKAKRGHFEGSGPRYCGRVKTVSLGIEDWTQLQVPDDQPEATEDFLEVFADSKQKAGASDASAKLTAPSQNILKRGDTHKYTHGHALILSGPSGKTGAARLAARGALRIGAGLVTLACPQEALTEAAAQLTAIMLQPLGEISDLIETLADSRINAVCLGPALGLGDEARATVTAVLAAGRATVLDADALTVHADEPQVLLDQLHANCVLTPHAGEFARLFPDLAETLDAPAAKGPAYSKVDATREAAARAGCTVLFKGPDTVIAAPDGQARINSAHYDRAAPWLATAGSGDVLAGFVTGLLARGFGPLEAAATGAWLHVDCALKFGPGLIAEDIPEMLPQVFRDLGL